MKNFFKDQRGAFLIVEAAIVYPVMLIMIMILLFYSMILTMKANMQSALETALIYYKRELTDTYVGFMDDLENNSVSATEYTRVVAPAGYSNIYKQLINEVASNPDAEKFEKMFFNNYRFLNFSSGKKGSTFNSSGIKVNLDSTTNFIIYRELNAAAEQTITLPFIKGMFGINNELKLKANAKIVVNDSVSVMRITDVVDYVIIKTGFNEKLELLFGENINKFLNFLNGQI
ncbi:MAG: hypothetical protein K1W17_11915 [Oscillospiraceae bacterium]